MKINWAYIKKPSVLIGIVVLFFVLLFMLNRGAKAAPTSSTVAGSTGPTDAQVAAQTQLALAQLSAGVSTAALNEHFAEVQDNNTTGLAIAQIQAALTTNQTQAQRDIAAETIAANVHGMDLQFQGLVNQNATAVEMAHEQYTYGLASQAINANTTIELSKDQLAAYKYNIASSLVAGAAHDGVSGDAGPALQAFLGASSSIPGVGWNV